MHQEHSQNENKRSEQSATSNGITILGFLLFLTGVSLFLFAVLDIVIRINSVKTALLLVIGIAAFKVGHMMISHCATLRKRPERRKHLLSGNG